MAYQRNVDSGWAWIVLAGAFITRLILGGLIWSLTAFFVIFHEEFAEDRSYTSLIGSVTLAFYHATGPVTTFLMQKYGVRCTNIIGSITLACNFLVNTQANGVPFLIISHSLFFGLGLSLINNSSLVALTQYFDQYSYLATGISLSGSGIGIFLFAFIIPKSISTFGWRGALLILSGCALQICICGSVIFPKKCRKQQDSKLTTKTESKKLPKWLSQLCTSGTYWCMNISFLFLVASFTTVTVLYKDFALFRGLETNFSWALAAFGAGDILGRTLAGLIASHKSINICLQTTVTHLGSGLTILCHLVIGDSIGLAIGGFLLGAFTGAQIALLCMIPAAVFGKELFVVVIGYVQTTAGLGAFIGPPIAGLIADQTGNYDWSFIFVASLNVLAALLVFAVFVLDKKYKLVISLDDGRKVDVEVHDEKEKMIKKEVTRTKTEIIMQ